MFCVHRKDKPQGSIFSPGRIVDLEIRTSKLLGRNGGEVAQILLHLPLRANVAEQLDDS